MEEFQTKFLLYLEAFEKSKKSGKPKEALLLCTLGDDCLDIFNAFKWENYEKNYFDFINNKEINFDFVIGCFDKYFEHKKNTVTARYRVFNCKQKQNIEYLSQTSKLKLMSVYLEI